MSESRKRKKNALHLVFSVDAPWARAGQPWATSPTTPTFRRRPWRPTPIGRPCPLTVAPKAGDLLLGLGRAGVVSGSEHGRGDRADRADRGPPRHPRRGGRAAASRAHGRSGGAAGQSGSAVEEHGVYCEGGGGVLFF